MYLDENIKLDFTMPSTLVNLLNEMDQICKDGDDIDFLLKLDEIEPVAKQCNINGRISDNELDLIFRRYGLR